MKQIFKFSSIAFALMLCFASCSDDKKDEPNGGNGSGHGGGSAVVSNVNKVLPLGMPVSVGNIKNMVYDEQGRLVSCNWRYDTDRLTFSYEDNTVTVTYIDIATGHMESKTTCTLGANGFVETQETIWDDGDKYSLNYYYDDAGHLVQIVSYSVDDDEESLFNITYNSVGDIVRVSCVDWNWTTEIFYTGDGVAEPIPNRSGIMFFDDCFGCDLDDFECLYYAGLLGIGTTHYPISTRVTEEGYSGTYKYSWQIGADGKPLSMTEDGNAHREVYNIEWK